MDYRQLRSFLTLAEELHFGRSAARMNIAQPALSLHIKNLESELGFPLFVRDRRHVALTHEGKQLVDNARLAVNHYEKFRLAARSLKQGFKGQLSIGYVGSAILDPAFLRLINGYKSTKTSIDITLEELDVNEQLQYLLDGQIDIGVVRPPVPAESRFESIDFVTRRLLAVLPESHPMADGRPIALQELANERFFIQKDPTGVGLGWSSIAACQRAGFTPQQLELTKDVSVAIGSVAMGLGVSLVPETQASVQLSGIRYCSLSDREATTSLRLAWLKEGSNQTVTDFVRYTRELIE